MKMVPRWLSVIGCCLLQLKSAHAMNLWDVYHEAIVADPTFQAATATRQAAVEALPQAWANLLPSLVFVGNTTGNRDFSGTPTFSSDLPVAAGSSSYHSNGYTLTLTQTLFNFSQYAGVRSAKATVEQADAVYAAAAQALMTRTADAYFDVLKSQENLQLTLAQKAALKQQYDQSKARYDVGLDPRTTLLNTKASYDGLVAQEIADRNRLVNAFRNLQAITGKFYPALDGLRAKLPLMKPVPTDPEAWVRMSEEQNLTVRAYQFAAEVARQSINQNVFDNLPSVQIVGARNYGNTGLTSQGAQATQTLSSSLGLQATVPIISGGSQISLVRQAQALYQQAMSQLDLSRRTTVSSTYQAYNTVVSDVSKIVADQQAVLSKEAAFESNQASFQAGLMTIVDVLNAQQDLYNAKRILANDQYVYLNDTLSLKQFAGTLSQIDMQQINALLSPLHVVSSTDDAPTSSPHKPKHHTARHHKK